METTGAGQMANVRADLIGLDVGAPRRHGQVLIVRLVFPTLCAVLCYRIEYRVAVISGVALLYSFYVVFYIYMCIIYIRQQ